MAKYDERHVGAPHQHQGKYGWNTNSWLCTMGNYLNCLKISKDSKSWINLGKTLQKGEIQDLFPQQCCHG